MWAGHNTEFPPARERRLSYRTCLLATAPPLFVFADQHLGNPAEIAQEHTSRG